MCIFSFVLDRVLEDGVLHRVYILGLFCPKQGQGLKPSAAPLYPTIGQVPPRGNLSVHVDQPWGSLSHCINTVQPSEIHPTYLAFLIGGLNNQTANYGLLLPWKAVFRGGGDSNIKKVGMLVENVEIDPYGRPIWVWLAHF